MIFSRSAIDYKSDLDYLILYRSKLPNTSLYLQAKERLFRLYQSISFRSTWKSPLIWDHYAGDGGRKFLKRAWEELSEETSQMI